MRGKLNGDIYRIRTKILEQPITKTLFWLAWPMIIANLVNMSYNLIDAFWLGKLGKEAFGAPTVSWPLIMLFYSIGMGYSFAGISLIAQYTGAGKLDKASRSAGNMLFFMFITAITISVIGYTFSPTILALMNIPSDVIGKATNYIRIIFIGIPFTFIGFAFIAIANSLGDTRTPTIINIISSTINLILDPILIFGLFSLPALGVVGAALATIFSRSLISIIGVYLLARGYKGIKLGLKDLVIEKWWLKKIFHIGTPMVLQQTANSLGFVIMTSIVSFFGSTAIAAYGVAIRIIDVMQAFTWGLQRATSIMVGQNIGAQQYHRAKKIAFKSMIIILSFLTIGSIIIYLTRDLTVGVFIAEKDVIIEGTRLLSIFVWSIPFFGLFFIANGVAAGSGHTWFMSMLGIIRLWVFRIGFSYFLAFILGMGVVGVWIAMTLSNVVAGLIAIIWLLRGTWARRVI